MLNDVKGGLALALRRWRQTASIALILAMVSVAMSLVLGEALTQATALREGANLRASKAVAFSIYYATSGQNPISDGTVNLLSQRIDRGDAYAAIINNLALKDSGAFDGVPTILVIGDRAFDMFPTLGAKCDAPCVLRGSNVTDEHPPITFRGRIFPFAGHLPRGAVWFDSGAGALNLDDMQILVLDPGDMHVLNGVEKEELTTRTVLLNPSHDDLEAFLTSVANDQLYLVPTDIAADQDAGFAQMMTAAAMYVLALLAFVGLATFSYGATVQEIISQEARAFVIRRMCGAPSNRLGVRLLVFLAAATVALPLAMCGALWLLGPPLAAGAMVMALVVIAVYVILSLLALRSIRRIGVLS